LLRCVDRIYIEAKPRGKLRTDLFHNRQYGSIRQLNRFTDLREIGEIVFAPVVCDSPRRSGDFGKCAEFDLNRLHSNQT
jgi:hypothetical protein